MNKLIILAIIIVGVAVSFLVLRNGSPETVETADGELRVGTRIGNLAPDFELSDYDGRTVALSDFRGQKPAFVNFWASWCPFCVEEMPLMADIQERHGKQYVTVAVNRGESLEAAKEFSDKIGVTGRMILLLDRQDSVYGRFNGFGMPYSVFIDKDGVIRDIKIGPLTEEELEGKLSKLTND